MSNAKLLRGGTSLLIGFTCIGIDQWLNLSVISLTESVSSPMFWAIPICGLAAAASLPVAKEMKPQGHKDYAIMLAIAFVVLSALSLGLSIDRSATTQGNKAALAQTGNMSTKLAKSAHERALKREHEALEAKKAECATGHGRKCRDRITELETARKELAKAEAAVLKAGVAKTVNPMAASIARALRFVDEKTVDTYFPLLMPIGLFLAQIGFIGAGVAMFISGAPSPKERVERDFSELSPETQGEIMRRWIKDNNSTQRKAAEHFGLPPSTAHRRLKLVK